MSERNMDFWDNADELKAELSRLDDFVSSLRSQVESRDAEIARLREERRWITVGERLPPAQGDDVLVARGPWEDGGYSIVRGWWNGNCWMFYGCDRDSPPVAFWMPLPPEPEGDG